MTKEENKIPIILLAFANDHRKDGVYLRQLIDESREIKECLETADQKSVCEVVSISNTRPRDIFEHFQNPKYRDRIAIFHYGGHADSFELLLEANQKQQASVDSRPLISFLGRRDALKIVFLNGCNTQDQVELFLDAGISLVIGTTEEIDDSIARMLAVQFYKSLGDGSTIEQAWYDAKDYVNFEQSSTITRGIRPKFKQKLEFAWQLKVRAGAEIFLQWDLAQAANNPLYGLPILGDTYELPIKPYRFLDKYTEQDTLIFFGRNHYIRTLYKRMTNPNASAIILLSGQSGVGKSSLLEAGLLPRLKASKFTVQHIRRNANIGFHQQLPKLLNAHSNKTILSNWKKVEKNTGKPFYIILDQVEEVFLDSSIEEEWKQLLAQLKSLFNVPKQERPLGKLILSFRKEYYTDISISLKNKELAFENILLERMNKRDIIEVVEGLVSTKQLQNRYNLSIEEGLSNRIADLLLQDSQSSIAPVLQIILSKLWQTQSKQINKKFTHAQFTQLQQKGILLDDFFEQQMAHIRIWNEEVEHSGLALDILNYHTTENNTARTRTLEQLREEYTHQEAILEELTNQLQRHALLASVDKHSKRLAHDTLAKVVREEVRKSNKPGQRAWRILETKMKDYNLDEDNTILGLNELNLVESGQKAMRLWTCKEEALIAKSRAYRACVEKDKRRKKITGWAMIGLILLIIGLLTWTVFQADRQAYISSYTSEALLLTKTDPKAALSAIEKALEKELNNANTLQVRHDIWSENEFYDKVLKHPAPVTSVAIAPNDSLIASVAAKTIYFWNRDGEILDSLVVGSDIKALTFSPNGQQFAIGTAQDAQLWTAQKPYRKINTMLHPDWVNAIVFSPDGQLLFTAGRDGIARLFDINGKELLQLATHQGEIADVAFSGIGNILLTGSWDGTAKLWNRSGVLLYTLDAHQDRILSVQFSENTNKILTTSRDKTAMLWDINANVLHQFKGHKKRVNTAHLLQNDEFILTTSDDYTLQLWDTIANPISTYKGHQNFVHDVAVSKDGRWFVSVSEDKTARIWRVESKVEQFIGDATDNTVTDIAISKDGKYIMTGMGSSEEIELDEGFNFDLDLDFLLESYPQAAFLWRKDGESVCKFEGHQSDITAVAIASDNQVFLTASKDSTIRLWNDKGEQISSPLQHPDEVVDVVFNTDNKQIISACLDGYIRFWNRDGKLLNELFISTELITSLESSMDGISLFISDYAGKIQTYTHQTQLLDTLFQEESPISSMCISPKNNYILTGHLDGQVKLLSTLGELIRSFNLNVKNDTGAGGINALAFSPDGMRFAVAVEGGLVQVFNLNGLLLQSIRDSDDINSLTFSQEGEELYFSSRDGIIHKIQSIY